MRFFFLSVYFETEWETLRERRLRRKLTIFYKIYNNNVPELLTNIITPLRRENSYNIRNQNEFSIPNYRLQLKHVIPFFLLLLILGTHLIQILKKIAYL